MRTSRRQPVRLAGALRRRMFGRLALAALALTPALAHAQAIERNLPPQAAAPPTRVAPAPAPTASDDDRPLGPKLGAIVAIGPTDPVRETAAAAIDLKGAPRLDTSEAARALRPFIGRPMTRRLISEIADAVVRYYRAKGFPFVQVTVPPQEITGGVLDIRVVEFRLGQVVVHGDDKEQAYLKSRLRVRPGAPIDARRLQEDLDQLNRYPFRSLSAAFTPGSALGDSDLILTAQPQRPFRVYATASNSGTEQTGWGRIALGAIIGGLPIRDSTLSVQVTGSNDFWGKISQLYPSDQRSRYGSVATRFDAPIAAGQGIQLSFDALETNVVQDPFSSRQRVIEGSAGYRTLVSNWLPPLGGEAEVGIEARSERRATAFGGVPVFEAGAMIFQVYGRWSGAGTAPFGGRSALSVTLHVSPGDVGSDNSDAALGLISGGRVKSAQYAYVNASLSQGWNLPKGLSLSTLIIGQMATGPLPDTEQMGLGGQDLVRGYSLDSGAFDQAILGRIELRARAVPLLRGIGDRVSPYVFADAAHGQDRGPGGGIDLASSGIGLDYAIGGAVTARLDGAHEWIRSRVPQAAAWRLQARLTVAY